MPKQPEEQLIEALQSGQKQLEPLLQKINNFNYQDNHGCSLLMWAAQKNREDVLFFLLEKGAEINAQDQDGRTALHWAGHHLIVQTLIDIGIDPNLRTKNGHTALHIAVKTKQPEIVKILLASETNTLLEDNTGKNSFDLTEKGSEIRNLISSHNLNLAKTLGEKIRNDFQYFSKEKYISINKDEFFSTIAYKLLTSLIYHNFRYHSTDEKTKRAKQCIINIADHLKLKGVTTIHKERIRLTNITKILTDKKLSSEQIRQNLNKILTTIESEENRYYSSYPSSDSDSEEERNFDKNSDAGKEKLLHASSFRSRAQYNNLFVRNSPTNPLKTKLENLKFEMNMRQTNKRDGEFYKVNTTQIDEEIKLVNQRIREGMSISEALTGIKTKFVVGQYRGVHHKVSEWNQDARKNHRKEDERKKSLYSASVFAAADAYPFFKFYKQDVQTRTSKVSKLKATATQLKENLLKARGNKPVIYSSESIAYTYNSTAEMLQDLYTKDYKKFHSLIKANKFNALLNDKNPFVSTGNTPRHALLYAYGIKYYGGNSKTSEESKEKAERLRPRWDKEGQAERPYSGKVYVTLHSLEDLFTEGPLDVINLNSRGRVNIINNILAEGERSFPAYIDETTVIDQHIAKYPSFKGEYKTIYEYKYGITEQLYNKFKAIITDIPHSEGAKYAKRLLGEWLCAYHEVKLIDSAKTAAEAQGKVLVYLKQDGTIDFSPDKYNETGMGSGAKNAESRVQIGLRREFRGFIARGLPPDLDNILRSVTKTEAQEFLNNMLDEIFTSSGNLKEKGKGKGEGEGEGEEKKNLTLEAESKKEEKEEEETSSPSNLELYEVEETEVEDIQESKDEPISPTFK